MLVFLKLGGSLITEKNREYTARLGTLERLAAEIATGLRRNPGTRLVLGHGSGSFGHAAASRSGTREGVVGEEAWRGFAEVWYQASRLNRMVIEALRTANLPAITLSPLSSVLAENGQVVSWDLTRLGACLDHALLPVIHGDVIFDQRRGGTILSTEDLFSHLSRQLHPQRILLAGLEEGVWSDFPKRSHIFEDITPGTLPHPLSVLGSAVGTDVTGGMRSKVAAMLNLVDCQPELEVLIFSGEIPGNVERVLTGEYSGSRLHR